MFRTKTGVALRDVLESQGEQMAVEVVRNLLKTKKVRPEDFSIREIWEACHPGMGDIHEAIVSSAFPKLTGELINSKLIAAYDAQPGIGDMLVTTVPSNVQNETIAGMTATESLEELGEGQEVAGSTFTEKYVTAQNKKYERRIDVTEETIMFDKTGQILTRANTLGANAKRYRERIILRGAQDLDSDVWRPSGSPTALYSTTNGNLVATNPFGESGMEGLRRAAQIMKDDSISAGADNYIFVDVNNLDVLVPVELEVEAWQLANSAKTPETNENAENFFKGRFKAMSSPFITAASATTWYAGNFKDCFWWMEVWPIQTITLRPGSEMEYLREIKTSVKVRMFGSITCVEPRKVFKCTA